jgi:hypothetical protein
MADGNLKMANHLVPGDKMISKNGDAGIVTRATNGTADMVCIKPTSKGAGKGEFVEPEFAVTLDYEILLVSTIKQNVCVTHMPDRHRFDVSYQAVDENTYSKRAGLDGCIRTKTTAFPYTEATRQKKTPKQTTMAEVSRLAEKFATERRDMGIVSWRVSIRDYLTFCHHNKFEGKQLRLFRSRLIEHFPGGPDVCGKVEELISAHCSDPLHGAPRPTTEDIAWLTGEHAADGTSNAARFAVNSKELGIFNALKKIAHGLGMRFDCKDDYVSEEVWIVTMGDHPESRDKSPTADFPWAGLHDRNPRDPLSWQEHHRRVHRLHDELPFAGSVCACGRLLGR